MAKNYRYPVLVAEGHEGLFSAMLLEEGHPVAVGATADDVLLQLKEYMDWKLTGEPGRNEPEFLEPRIINIRVQLQPEYRIKDKVYPCSEQITLQIPCVHGRKAGGMFIGLLPTLDVHFEYYERDALRSLALHFAQTKLAGKTPLELAMFLPVKSRRLEEILVRLKPQDKSRHTKAWHEDNVIENLAGVAEPLSAAGVRGKYMRACRRDKAVDDLYTRLNTKRTNVLLVGDPGVGKTTILTEVARRFEREARQQKRRNPYRIWLTSAHRIIAGMRYLGQWQERCEKIIDELSEVEGVLCVDNLLDLVRTGGQGPLDSVAAFLAPYMRKGELTMVAETTPAELDGCRRLLPGFADQFQVLKVEPFVEKDAKAVLDEMSDVISRNLHLTPEPGVPELVYRLFSRFAPYTAFPGQAVTFLVNIYEKTEEMWRMSPACAVTADRARRAPPGDADCGACRPDVRLRNAEVGPTSATKNLETNEEGLVQATSATKSLESNQVTKDRVLDAFARQSGLPAMFLRDEITLQRSDVLDFFKARIIGQDRACGMAADVVTRFKAGMNDPGRPVSVLIFCGPTGVGKTALARALSDYFFGHGDQSDRLIRLDMSEYGGYDGAARLISALDGGPSDFIKRMRRQPFSLVLLDEVEKAHPQVFDVLMNVFDEGRLTDPYGRVTTFRSAIVIMTSNLGATQQGSLGFGEQSIVYEDTVMGFFRPEFFNRMDGVVTFDPLPHDVVLKIAEKELRELPAREGLKASGIRLSWSDAVVEKVAAAGFDVRYGARPLQRAVETEVVTPIARFLAENPTVANITLRLDVGRDRRVIVNVREYF